MTPRAGFTLVEVLVAVALTAALVAAGLAAIGPLTDFWERSADRLTIETEARHVLDLLERDLSSVVWRRDGAVWLAVTVQPDQPLEGGHAGVAGETWAAADPDRAKPGRAEGSLRLRPSLFECRFGQAGVWLRFFASSGSISGAPVGPVAISYQMVRRRQGEDTPAAYQLFRAEVPPEVCFVVGYDLREDSPYDQGDAVPGSAGNIRRPPVETLLADRVIDLGIRLLAPDGEDQLAVLFPLEAAPDYHASGPVEFPVEADVFLRLITPQGARLLAAYESGAEIGRAGEWWSIVERHSTVFTRRIALPRQVLP